jgi:hypothetical protein
MKSKRKTLFSTTSSVVKKGTVAMLCMVMAGVFRVSGCKKDNSNGEKEPEYPLEIPFTEYTLAEPCQWTNLTYDNTVIVINSEEELNQYVTSTDGVYPKIDFSKHTLIVASGKTDFKTEKIVITDLQQLSKNEYESNIEISLDGIEISQQWIMGLLVEKVKDESIVKLNVSYKKSEYLYEIPFTKYVIKHFCQWTNLAYDNTVIIIDSDEQLSQFLNCQHIIESEIDFSTHTLLLANGKTDSEIALINVSNLQRLSEKEYELDLEIILDSIVSLQQWAVAIIVEKIDCSSTVTLKAKECHRIVIPFEEYHVYYSSYEPTCWKNLNYYDNPDFIHRGAIYIINCNEELEHYLICNDDFPSIDFSERTLLLASGLYCSTGSNLQYIILSKICADKYLLDIKIWGGVTGDMGYYCIAILSPKIGEDETVLLNFKD